MVAGLKGLEIMIEAENRDHLVHLNNFQVDLSKLDAAIGILYSLVHENGDEHHLKWVTDKLSDDVAELAKTFSKYFDADIAKLGRSDEAQPVAPR